MKKLNKANLELGFIWTIMKYFPLINQRFEPRFRMFSFENQTVEELKNKAMSRGFTVVDRGAAVAETTADINRTVFNPNRSAFSRVVKNSQEENKKE